MKLDDNMETHYSANRNHYDTGLMRIGCSERQSRAYSRYFRDEIRNKYYRMVEAAINSLRKSSAQKFRILDVGCGLGDDVKVLSSKIENAEFVGTELSETAIKVCQDLCLPNAKFICGTIHSLIGNSESFDLIINFCVMEHVSSPAELLKDCQKLLKNSGLIVVAIPNHDYWLSWDWPNHVLKKLSGREALTHSVKRNVMDSAIYESELKIVRFEVEGFRPPQRMYRYIPEQVVEFVINQLPNANKFMHRAGLGNYLYLDLYCIGHRESPATNFEYELDIDENGNVFSGLVTACVCYFLWWSGNLVAGVVRRFRRLCRGGAVD